MTTTPVHETPITGDCAVPAPQAGPAPLAGRRGRGPSGTGLVQILLVAWAALALGPLLWALLSAFKDSHDLFADPWGLPTHWQWGNFARAWSKSQIGRYILNTVIVISGSLVLTMLLGSMAAYVLARFRFVGNRLIYYAFLAGMAFPVFLALVPLFFVVKNLGLLSTYQGLILVYTAYSLPFTVFFLTSFFQTLPTSIAEAAYIDGCSHYGVFFRVMLPMAKPGLFSVGLFNFLNMWNQYLLPLALNPDEHHYVIAQGLASLAVQQGYASDWGGLFAGMVIAAVPVVAVYLGFSHRIQAGLSVGLLK